MILIDDTICELLNLSIPVDQELTKFILTKSHYSYRKLNGDFTRFHPNVQRRLRKIIKWIDVPFASVRTLPTATTPWKIIRGDSQAYTDVYGYKWGYLKNHPEVIAPNGMNALIIKKIHEFFGNKATHYVMCITCNGHRTLEKVTAMLVDGRVHMITTVKDVIPAIYYDA